ATAVDFDDLQLSGATLLRDNPELRRTLAARFRYIRVDEYQDTNFVQYMIVRCLSQDHPNLAVTGDPDQSIYGWRGANLNNILEFERDYPQVRVVRLEQNYRSTKRILHVADTLISHNVRRKPKALFTENPDGEPVRLVVFPTNMDETDQIVGRIANEIQQGRRRAQDFAIFYRVNWLSRSFEQSLRSAGVPYQIVKGLEFYQRKEIKDVIAYLQLINNPRHDAALRRIINVPPRKIGPSTVDRLAEHANERGISLLAAAREAGLVASLPKRSAAHVAAFVAMYDRLSLLAAQPLTAVLEAIVRDTGYIGWLEGSDDEDDAERLANIQELVTAATDFDHQHPGDGHLEEFLEQVALVSDTDDWESASDRVSLMTLHAAKGLEFPVVFLVGAEQGLLPHERTTDDPDQIEEERRLMFVGITRAEEELQISYATRRLVRGNLKLRIASEFLLELPRDQMEFIAPRSLSPRARPIPPADPDACHDDAWDEEVYEVRDVHPASRPPAESRSPGLMTAAQLLEGASRAGQRKPVARADASPTQVDRFQLGMLIRHPRHGIGKIIDISGNGSKRMATVQFFDTPRPAKFLLQHCTMEVLNGEPDFTPPS
ncbi:MAG: ATP-dependent helicase, partial [Pirellulaceae bacterium]